MKKFFCLFSLICLVVSLSGTVKAEQKIIEASGSYVMDTQLDETFADATSRAREEAKRAAIDAAGVYVQSYSVMKNLELDYDEVKTVAAQLLKIQDEKRATEIVEENLIRITVTIKALVEENDDAVLKTIMEDKGRLEEAARRNAELQKERDELKRQMEELKRQNNPSRETIAQNNSRFNATLELEQGNNFYLRGEYRQAVAAYSRALKLNPNSVAAYNNRGNTYAELEQYKNALKDLQTAVNLANDDARTHNNLGGVYLLLKNYAAAVGECTQAIRLNPQFAEAYYNRALAYSYLGRYDEALPDAKRALDLNPSDADSQKLYSQISGRMGR